MERMYRMFREKTTALPVQRFPHLPYKVPRLWFHRRGTRHAYVYIPMTRTSIPRPRRMAAAGLLLLFTWSAVTPVLYRMDCINSGRSVSSWFAPVSCPAMDVEGTGKHLAPACCIFYTADAVDGPNVLAKHTVVQLVTDALAHVSGTVAMPHADRFAVRVLSDHGPPLHLGQRLAHLGILRV